MSLKYAILGLLDQEPHYGYEIKQKFEHMMGSLWPVSYGQLYPTLRKLSEQNFVTMKTVQGKKAVEKNVYSITKEGSAFFLSWLKKQRKKDQISIKDEFTLGLFFIDRLQKEETEALLRNKLADIEEKERFYLEENKKYGADTPIYKKLLSQKMLLHIEAEKKWLQEVLTELS